MFKYLDLLSKRLLLAVNKKTGHYATWTSFPHLDLGLLSADCTRRAARPLAAPRADSRLPQCCFYETSLTNVFQYASLSDELGPSGLWAELFHLLTSRTRLPTVLPLPLPTGCLSLANFLPVVPFTHSQLQASFRAASTRWAVCQLIYINLPPPNSLESPICSLEDSS